MDRLQRGARVRGGPGVAGRQLIMADAVLCRAIEIIVEGNAGLLRRAQKGEADGRRIDGIGDAERAAIAVKSVDQPLVVFRSFEIRQNVAIAPTLATRI